ncbi:MAG TPA: WXG100 family type VII secretion target [Actinocrinis sp.]|nr:WXG100 family type VII secretion target [Actinocrinis sp.]
MGMYGMDIDAVRSFAKQLDSKADEIEQIINALTSGLGSVQWEGPDASGFRQDWETCHRSQLKNVADALRQTATTANNNATQQEQTSAH